MHPTHGLLGVCSARALTLVMVCALGCGEGPGHDPAESQEEAPVEAEDGYALDVSINDEDAPEVGDPAAQSGSFADADEARYVFGDDDRRAVRNTSVAPYRSVVLIVSTYPKPNKDGKSTFGCTGTLIGSDVVLTAAHCVYDPEKGGEAVKVRVTPGSFPDAAGEQSALPVGSSLAKRLFFPAAFRRSPSYDLNAEKNDYAVIRLQQRLGDRVGTRGYASLPTSQGRAMRAIAYRQFVCSPTAPSCNKSTDADEMYEVQGRVGPIRDGVVFDSYMDGVAGSSGAGITGDGVDGDTVFAIEVSEHDDSGKYNASLLLTPPVIANIRTWSSAVVR